MPIKSVSWVQCTGDVWCTLSKVNLSKSDYNGVYMIWKPDDRVIRIGQGNIKDRLSAHRDDPEITQHGKDLRVTWAAVSSQDLDGVERFLANEYPPVVGDRFPDASPIPVTLPWKS